MNINIVDIKIGDTIVSRKQHPCGSKNWLVLRTGADFKLKCEGCGHQIFIDRVKIDRFIKDVINSQRD